MFPSSYPSPTLTRSSKSVVHNIVEEEDMEEIVEATVEIVEATVGTAEDMVGIAEVIVKTRAHTEVEAGTAAEVTTSAQAATAHNKATASLLSQQATVAHSLQSRSKHPPRPRIRTTRGHNSRPGPLITLSTPRRILTFSMEAMLLLWRSTCREATLLQRQISLRWVMVVLLHRLLRMMGPLRLRRLLVRQVLLVRVVGRLVATGITPFLRHRASRGREQTCLAGCTLRWVERGKKNEEKRSARCVCVEQLSGG